MTENASPHPLTDRAIARLQALAEGNGVSPSAIELIGTDEKQMTLQTEMHLSLGLSMEKNRFSGAPKASAKEGEVQILGSVQEIESRAEEFRVRLTETARWINEAVDQLKTAPGQGFGIQQAEVTLDAVTRTFRAFENCEACQGAGALRCDMCNATGSIPCTQCQGRGQELCTHCQGRGHEPNDPQRYCSFCNGSTQVPCRICFGRRTMSCHACGGQGKNSCNVCRGDGKFTVEQKILPVVRCDLRVLDTGALPSALRRMLDRGGLKALGKGHAHVTMGEAVENPDKTAFIPYTATFPFAEPRIRIDGRAMKLAVIGEKAVIRDMPPFLDPVFEKELGNIEKKIGQSGALDSALKLRALKDMFGLLLAGGDVDKAFRVIYPVGFSPAMQTRMKTMLSRVMQESTFMPRAAAAGFSLLVLTGIFYALIASGIRTGLAHALFTPAAYIFDAIVAVGAFFFVDFALRFAAAAHLRRLSRASENVSTFAQKAGSLGICVGAIAILMYAAMLWFLKATPSIVG
jgi:hypothetical protein